MKTFKTTRDVVDWLRRNHRHLSRIYARQRDAAAKERIRMLLDYLSRHEQTLETALADLQQEEPEAVLDTYFQYVPEDLEEVTFFEDGVLQKPDLTVDDVIRIVVRNDEALTRLYGRLAQTAPTAPVTDMFERLKENLEQERARSVENALRLKDI
jgi:hypothetical protein